MDGLGDPAITPAFAPAFADEVEMRFQLGLKGASGHHVLHPKRCEVIPSGVTTDPKLSQDFRAEYLPILGRIGMDLGSHPKFVPRVRNSKRRLDLLRLVRNEDGPVIVLCASNSMSKSISRTGDSVRRSLAALAWLETTGSKAAVTTSLPLMEAWIIVRWFVVSIALIEDGDRLMGRSNESEPLQVSLIGRCQ